jgi:hypothetical protein
MHKEEAVDNVRVIHSFQKNQEEEIRFSLKEYKERRYLDIRLWFVSPNDGEYRPTKKGITLSLDHLAEIKRGLERTSKAVSELALQAGSNSVK